MPNKKRKRRGGREDITATESLESDPPSVGCEHQSVWTSCGMRLLRNPEVSHIRHTD